VHLKVSQEDRGAASTHHFILPDLLPTGYREKFMQSVEEEQLRERPELDSAPEFIGLMHSVEAQLRERLELDSQAEFLRLVGQCSILVVIAGIVAGLIAA
jgi:hypothetical protein